MLLSYCKNRDFIYIYYLSNDIKFQNIQAAIVEKMESESERKVSCDLDRELAASSHNSMAGSSSTECPKSLDCHQRCLIVSSEKNCYHFWAKIISGNSLTLTATASCQ